VPFSEGKSLQGDTRGVDSDESRDGRNADVISQSQGPASGLAELVALVRSGGVVAVQDIGRTPWLCEPFHPAWEALVSTLLWIWRATDSTC
jgi:hypothetical protein